MVQETTNFVLRALPVEIRRTALEACDRVRLDAPTLLAAAGEPVAAVHFPETMAISSVTTYHDGSMIEMANVGREACTGVGLILGGRTWLTTTQVQVGGVALVMPAHSLVRLREAHPEVERVLMASVRGLFYQVMVSGACNAAHRAKERLARWLLTMSDRSGEETMPLTHDFLAAILGVRRATVTGAAADLQAAGLIEYRRGRVTITDPGGLKRASCECYELVRESYGSLLPDLQDHD